MPNRPHVLVVDCSQTVLDAVRGLRLDAVEASFGPRVVVTPSDRPVQLFASGLPHSYGESDVVIIDLNPPMSQRAIISREAGSVAQTFASAERGIVDWRPLQMQSTRERIDRIVEHGGILIIFLDARQFFGFVTGLYLLTGGGAIFSSSRNPPVSVDTWSFSSTLESLGSGSSSDHGTAISARMDHRVARELAAFLEDGAYTCTLRLPRDWEALASSKFGATVAAASPPVGSGRGRVLLLPQVTDKAGVVTKLLREVLPELQPQLFESGLSAKWVESEPYELPTVNSLKMQISEVESEADRRTRELRDAIDRERVSNGYLHTLLTGTGDDLVTAVQQALHTLGFKQVIDVDAAIAEEGGGRQKREDLQIHDRSPILIVEVKGIAGYPSDDHALAVQKYVVLRMKEWGRTNVQGLAIINHQRHIPALARENTLPFRQEILDNALELGFGLLTTWDLHRLTRSAIANGWDPEVTHDVLYRAGRIEPVPSHYHFLGTVDAFIPRLNVVGIRLTADVEARERIAFETATEFVEQEINSLQVDNADVTTAQAGALAGTTTTLSKLQIPTGTRVFLVGARSA